MTLLQRADSMTTGRAATERDAIVPLDKLIGLIPYFRPYEIAFILGVTIRAIEATMSCIDPCAAAGPLTSGQHIKQPEAL